MARRVSVKLPAILEVGADRLSVMCVNISSSGVGLKLASPPGLGTPVGVTITLPNGVEVAASAEVVRISPTSEESVGLRFTNLSQASLSAIYGFLTARSQ